MIIIENNKLVPKGYLGFTIFPFIFLKASLDNNSEKYKLLLNHERIHINQQIELAVILFLLIYGINYLINLLKYKSFDLAYKNIVFEKEAYNNEKNLNYLKVRKKYAWIKYFKG